MRGASEASEQSERAKLSGACSGFPLLTHAFAGVPLLSLASLARQWFACCLFFLLLYLASHTSTALKRFRSYCCMLPLLSYVFALPVHLLRQVPLECFFRFFRASFFHHPFEALFGKNLLIFLTLETSKIMLPSRRELNFQKIAPRFLTSIFHGFGVHFGRVWGSKWRPRWTKDGENRNQKGDLR